ncbi:hypothetical protein [Glycomyces halotolerans]
MAAAPADADALVEAGALHGGLAEAAETAWRQFPAPSVRIRLTVPAEVEPALAGLPGRLASWRPGGEESETAGEPSMAERADDRDGLMLDALHVPLGPLLPHWPAGLRLTTRLQGDVIQHAEVEVLGLEPRTGSFWAAEDRAAARRLDAIARLLGVAGWTAMRWRCQALRDRALAGEPGDRLGREVAATAARIRRGRLLRRELTGLGTVPGAGDAADRLDRWLTDAVDAVREPDAGTASPRPSSAEWLEQLPDLVVGAELTAARLIVASADIDTAEAEQPSTTGARHG